jgi:hypothetical protein
MTHKEIVEKIIKQSNCEFIADCDGCQITCGLEELLRGEL